MNEMRHSCEGCAYTRKSNNSAECAPCFVKGDRVNYTPKKPKSTGATGIEAMVCADIAERQKLGLAKYGTTLADNKLELKEWLRHQYQELLDAALYCKRAIVQIENEEKQNGNT